MILTRISRKDLPYIQSVKPYFFVSRSRKVSASSSIGTQCEKVNHKRCESENFKNLLNYGDLNLEIFKKMTSRPSSPVTYRKCSNYISAAKRKKTEWTRLKPDQMKTSRNLMKKQVFSMVKSKEPSTFSFKTVNKYNCLMKNSRKSIKLSKTPGLLDSASNVSLDFILPRYKS